MLAITPVLLHAMFEITRFSLWQPTETGIASSHLWYWLYLWERNTTMCRSLSCACVTYVIHMLMTDCTHIFSIWGWLHPNGDGAMLKTPRTRFPMGLLFSSLMLFPPWGNVMAPPFCILHGFEVLHSLAIHDPHQQMPAGICLSTRLSKSTQKLLLWQQSDLVNY